MLPEDLLWLFSSYSYPATHDKDSHQNDQIIWNDEDSSEKYETLINWLQSDFEADSVGMQSLLLIIPFFSGGRVKPMVVNDGDKILMNHADGWFCSPNNPPFLGWDGKTKEVPCVG